MRASASPMLAAALLALAGCGGEPAPLPEGAVAVQDRKLDEMSGLAASRAQPGVLWAINDSGNAGRLFRLGEDGSALGRVDVDGAWLRDSESLAYWNEDGRHWLLIGDVGDNRGWRGSVVVHAVPEPAPGQEDVDIAWSLRFRYPDGARDAEAITVDAQAGDLLVLSKRDRPARLYRVPLSARHGDGIVQAEHLASLPEEAIAGAVTSLDLSEDGRDLLVLSYGSLYRWHRLPGETWPEVLARAPEALPRPAMRKAEALTLTGTPGEVLIGAEQWPAPLWSTRFAPAGKEELAAAGDAGLGGAD
ncbi:hypothetical protein F0415_08370 [Arenimonas fontis]|uniref:Integral membrane protein n=2 Tax=Arenimonas fontis TaxID=2608255 RepID=A0A5B2ZBZ2_9GAMM|nr:hypothetical protein F0415_08370 [Arenimonas fontis]